MTSTVATENNTASVRTVHNATTCRDVTIPLIVPLTSPRWRETAEIASRPGAFGLACASRICLDQQFKGSDGEFLGRRWLSIQNKQVWCVRGRSLSIHARFIELQMSRFERLKIATAFFFSKNWYAAGINHAYPIAMTVKFTRSGVLPRVSSGPQDRDLLIYRTLSMSNLRRTIEAVLLFNSNVENGPVQ
jgi:hypothetical protein